MHTISRNAIFLYSDCKIVTSMKRSAIGFSDDSSIVHGSILYLRRYDDKENRIEVKFIGEKSKVNSVKEITVPPAEIC